LKNIKYFVVDECDRMMDEPRMRQDVLDIFTKTPVDK
jgi:ATP-dependent RNA helicase UAP56/SUB2